MLKLIVPGGELYDEATNTFVYPKDQALQLEHSLVSLSKWESKWCKPFLAKGEKTVEETVDYIRCMTITQNVDPEVYSRITNANLDLVKEYIGLPMTATTFPNQEKATNRETITSELIYYWMISMNIPFECQKWHLTRLLTLINVCSIKNSPAKKMSKNEIMSRNKALNASRRDALHTKG